MSHPFVESFLLPLVKGGALHVGRPLGQRAVDRVVRASLAGGGRSAGDPRRAATAGGAGEPGAMDELARHRLAHARTFLPHIGAPALDEPSVRLGVAIHNLLALGHPHLGGRGFEARHERIVAATLPVADLGAPASAETAVERHSLLVRLPEITRTEYVVDSWVGRRRFVGRTPPARVLALAGPRSAVRSSLRRPWFKEIGVPGCARPVWLALHRASPLGEALDPLRLDPPFAWERVLPILRFPRLCRTIAGRVLEIGLDAAGGALAAALLRFAAQRPGPRDAVPAAAALAFAIRFIAHTCWLDEIYGRRDDQAGDPHPDLAALLVAAEEAAPDLVWPSDVRRDSDVGRPFAMRLLALRRHVDRQEPDRRAAMASMCRRAAGERAAAGPHPGRAL
jgi:hypothetical protein